MEKELLLGFRNVMLFSMMFAAGFLFPDSFPDLLRVLMNRWKRYKTQKLAKKRKRADKARGKFWEIDLTKFEP